MTPLKALRNELKTLEAAVLLQGKDEMGAAFLAAYFQTAPLDDLIEFIAEVDLMCHSPFYMAEGEGGVVEALKILGCLPTTLIKPQLARYAEKIQQLDRSDVIRIAQTAHPCVMAYLIRTTGVGSRDFVRKDDKGLEDQLGIELGL